MCDSWMEEDRAPGGIAGPKNRLDRRSPEYDGGKIKSLA